MAEIGGMLATAVVKAAFGKVAAAAGDRVAQHRRFGKDIQYMRDALESIEALMEDAERRSVEDKSVQLWLSRLTTASYDISDIFDELEANAARKSALQKVYTPAGSIIQQPLLVHSCYCSFSCLKYTAGALLFVGIRYP
jgi:hypothetical protein